MRTYDAAHSLDLATDCSHRVDRTLGERRGLARAAVYPTRSGTGTTGELARRTKQAARRPRKLDDATSSLAQAYYSPGAGQLSRCGVPCSR